MLPGRGNLPNDIGASTAPTDTTMSLHAPSKGWFVASLIIAVIAVVGTFSSIPYVTTYGIWIAILAYIVLAVGNLAAEG